MNFVEIKLRYETNLEVILLKNMQTKEFRTEIGGKPLIAQFNDLAEQANGSVLMKYGDTVVLATAVMSKYEKEGIDFFPLSVDYEEKFYASGQILGSRFVRREGRPTEEATLTSRVIDRTIRPLFPGHMHNEVQVVVTVLSVDKDDPDVLAINAASLALATSNIPWNGPVSAVRLSLHSGGEVHVNPPYTVCNQSDLEFEIVACGKDGNINMIEAGGKEVSEDKVAKLFKRASDEIEKFQKFQKEIIAEMGKEKTVIEKKELPAEEAKLFTENITPKLDTAIFGGGGKESMKELGEEWTALYKETFPDGDMSLARGFWEEEVNNAIHNGAVVENKRADGRPMNEVRELRAKAGGISGVLHGTGIFYRGGTHVVSVLTLGGPGDSLIIDGMEEQGTKHFMHHYNFPPFSTGETGRMGVNRRMIGHGALAEKALSFVLPPQEEFPYTIRIVSECVASNGSTSMASVCASTLALMDAGVPIKAPVAGIAMGLMLDSEQTLKGTEKPAYKILTDIQGPEDHHGDMDFKVAGTKTGVTAIQMDVKVDGIPINILEEALEDAKNARFGILNVVEEAISAPRKEISPSAPKIITIRINPEKIGLVIGPGGKTINKIKDESGAEIDIEEDGLVYLTGKNGASEKARAIIEALTREYKVGERFEGEVIKILDFGVVVKIGSGPNAEGLVHISEIAPFRIETVASVLKEGDSVPVVIKEINEEKKRISLSIKDADPNFIKKPK